MIDPQDFARFAEVGCPADFNCDDFVDNIDFGLFAEAFNEFATTAGDFNGDSVTDNADYVIFASFYNDLLCPEYALGQGS